MSNMRDVTKAKYKVKLVDLNMIKIAKIRQTGQAEIIGFLVIIILLVFIGIFYLRFASKEKADFGTEIRQDIEVSKMARTLSYFTLCEGVQMKDAIEGCIMDGFACNKDACALVEEKIDEIMGVYGWEYGFSIFEGEEIKVKIKGCKGDMDVEYYEDGKIKFRLERCL